MKTENLVNRQPKHYTSFSGIKHRNANYTHSNVIMGSLERNVNNDEIKLNNKTMNKATAGINPSGRLSFKGRIPTPVAKTIGEKLAVNKYFNKFLDILSDNTLVADALIALFLTAIVRPASIYAIPTKDPVEKKKNNYQVAHSASTGILGLATTLAVAEPIKRAVKKILKNPEKYVKGDTSFIKNNERVFKETAGRLHQPIFLPLRAAATIAIVKPVLEFFGLSKSGKSVSKADKAKIDYSFMNLKGNESKSFKGFDKIATAGAKSNPSFKGAGAVVTEGLAKGIGKIAGTNKFKQFIEWFKDKKQWFPHLIAAESLWLSGFYMEETARSKTIEKDQKLPMILNQGITALLCTWGAYKLDGVINNKLGKYKETYQRMNPELVRKSNIAKYLEKRYANNPQKMAELLQNPKFNELKKTAQSLDNKLIGIRLLGPVVIFTTIYRYIGPVFVTPFANWLSEKIQPHKKAA